MTGARLDVDLDKRLGRFHLQAAFTAPEGVISLFGPSGAGKTSLTNMLAGLARPDRGHIRLGGEALVDTGARIFVPTRRRRLGYVFQDGRLFPHMTVRQNLLYGRWLTRRQDRWGSLEALVELLGIAHLLDRQPGTLSGGESRRVAIGRALLASPRLLLLDEPLAGLDAARKEEILPYLERLRDEMRLPMVHVSHDLDEVIRLADTLVLIDAGRIVASGPVAELLGRLDLVRYTGRFETSTVLSATVAGHDVAAGITRLAHKAGPLVVPLAKRPVGASLRLRIMARDVSLATGPIGTLSIRNRLAATVVEIARRDPPVVDVKLDAGGEPILARLTVDALSELDLHPGAEVTALIKSVAFERG